MESLALHSLSTTALSLSSSSSAVRSASFLHHRRPRLSLLRSSHSPSPSPSLSLSLSSSLFATSHHSLSSKPLLALKPLNSSAAHSSAVVSADLPKSPPPKGAKLVPLFFSVGIGLLLRFAVPKPPELTVQAWQLLSIFISTIAGLIVSPLPVGAWAFLGLTASIITKTLPFTTAFCAFTNEVIWLIVISFFFARGFVKTGLGDRIATYFVKWLGKSTLGLSYGLTFSEALIAPAMPSTTARAGGVFLPIIKSLSLSSGSAPGGESKRKLGSYLIMTQFQV